MGDVIESDMKWMGVSESDVRYRVFWKLRTRIVAPNSWERGKSRKLYSKPLIIFLEIT